MKQLSKLSILLLATAMASGVFARGPGAGAGSGMAGASSGQGRYLSSGQQASPAASQTSATTPLRGQTRDPASQPAAQPSQTRDRLHVPGTGLPSATTSTN